MYMDIDTRYMYRYKLNGSYSSGERVKLAFLLLQSIIEPGTWKERTGA
jgi:hypothetical protein